MQDSIQAQAIAPLAMNTLDQGQDATDQLKKEDNMPELVANNINKVLGGPSNMSTPGNMSTAA